MAVGAGIDFSLLVNQPVTLIGLVAGFILLKLAVLFGLAKFFHMNGPDASRFSFSLAQGGEFAFVLISFAAGLGLLAATQSGMLVAVVAISMACAPLLMILDDKVMQPRFARGGTARQADAITDTGARVIIAGHGRYGMTVGRLLGASGIRAVVLDHDAEQIDALRRFGYKVYYGDASRHDLLEAAGARDAEVLVIAVDDRDKITEIVNTAKHHFPHLLLFARAFDRVHAYELLNHGVAHVFREVFASSVDMGRDVLVSLGRHPFEAHRAARTFRAHDERLIRKAAAHVDDDAALVDIARKGRAEIENVLAADIDPSETAPDHAWEAPDRTRE
jgi:voltage-gated potassium channel Kch